MLLQNLHKSLEGSKPLGGPAIPRCLIDLLTHREPPRKPQIGTVTHLLHVSFSPIPSGFTRTMNSKYLDHGTSLKNQV